MRYRFTVSTKEHSHTGRTLSGKPVRAGFKTVRSMNSRSKKSSYGTDKDTIILSSLFETAELGAPSRSGVIRLRIRRYFLRATVIIRRVARKTGIALRKSGAYVRQKFTAFCERARLRRQRRKKLPSLLMPLTGALTAAVVIALFSVFTVIWKLVITNYFGDYYLVRVPALTGREIEYAESMLDSDFYNLTVEYEYNSDIPAGTVISQKPSAGVERRVVEGELFCNISVVVSRGIRTYTMNDYSGAPLRDSLLELKNSGIRFSLSEEYSDTVKSGCVISTNPAPGEIFTGEQTVILRVSLGREILSATVPNICGLTEIQASALLSAAGLVLGEVNYAPSNEPAGTIIYQSIPAYTSAELGTAVSFTVSAGYQFNERKVPELYGLTLSEATQKLAECGLIPGNVYAVASSEPSGTVVAQSPKAGTAITSAVTTVEIYISA